MRRFLGKDAADPKTMATIYRKVFLYVLLYCSESWVMTSDLMRQLGVFIGDIAEDPRIDRRLHSTRRGREMDLPEKRGSTYKGGCADDRKVQSEEARDDHEICGDEE